MIISVYHCIRNLQFSFSIEIVAMDCTWSDWGDWTECSTTCDIGLRQRNRTKEVAEIGGGTCNGQSIESALCNEKDCGNIFIQYDILNSIISV